MKRGKFSHFSRPSDDIFGFGEKPDFENPVTKSPPQEDISNKILTANWNSQDKFPIQIDGWGCLTSNSEERDKRSGWDENIPLNMDGLKIEQDSQANGWSTTSKATKKWIKL